MSEVIAFRKFSSLPNYEIRLIHNSLNPAEVYDGDKIIASCNFYNSRLGASVDLKVRRISPLGVELELPHDNSGEPIIKVGEELDLTLKIGRHSSEFSGLVVCTAHAEAEQPLIGIRWCQSKTQDGFENDRRQRRRWLCGEEYLPTGIAPNPTRFNDFLYFKVRDISNEGMQLAASLRNKFIVPGMVFDSMISFPLIGQVSVKFEIKNARIRTFDGKEQLALGSRIIGGDERILETLGQYMLQFGPKSSVHELRDYGFDVKSAAGAIDFGFVKTAEDYREVLDLRKATYSAAGKVSKSSPSEELGDLYDVRARIITAKHKNVLVGSLRLMFHNPEDPTEHEQFCTFPKVFPRKDELVEVTRVCTHPDYRGSDLFYALMKQMMLAVSQSGRRWIMGSATQKLIHLYLKLGFRGTGVNYTHKDLGSEEHEIILGDVRKLVTGGGVGPAIWNEVYADVADYLRNQQGIEQDPLSNLRISAYRALRPLTGYLTRGIRNPKKR